MLAIREDVIAATQRQRPTAGLCYYHASRQAWGGSFYRHYGPPVHARQGGWTPQKLAVAKAEFDSMERWGLCEVQQSLGLTLHLVPKKGVAPFGDYRRLNDATTPDRHPIPYIQDFSARLAGRVLFSKIDLIRVITRFGSAARYP
ncbi:hypothetical protein AAFF_G00328870 [Aldrovandia affinis]|uniref:Uncharacterized protein n=1 Tax=Aldrovandia affinis TaxID=143900 RepID=A0AAD7WPT2_9TELE|nr:hypothetical protein AAFF_G00328870 [Aldrovandia affinis]